MSAPATTTSTDWSDILDNSHISSSVGDHVASSSASSNLSMTSATATTRKRTLTYSDQQQQQQQPQSHHPLPPHSTSTNSSSSSSTDAASIKQHAPTKPSSVSSSSSSMRSGSAHLSTKAYYERCTKVAAARVEDMVKRHYAFRTDANCRVNPTQWKLVKAKNHLACYRRIGKTATGAVPDVLATGAIPGVLDDVLHGVVNLSIEAMQIENAYSAGDMVDTRILATLVAPSLHAPFTSVSIKWVLRNHEELSRHRDYVFVEATGVTTAPDGERVGYHLVHSIALPSAPAFTKDTNIIRGELSTCFIYRQQLSPPQQSVEVYFVGNINPHGHARDRPALTIAINALVASTRSVQCAMMKKLAYSLRTKEPLSIAPVVPSLPTTTRSRKNTLTALLRAETDRESNNCSVCRRHLRFSSRHACALCTHVCCSRCCVAKKLFLIEHGVFNPVKLDFCMECIVQTTALSATFVAARELAFAMAEDDASDERERSSVMSDDTTADEQRYTIVTDGSSSSYNNGSSDRSSRIWMPSDRPLRRPNAVDVAVVLAPIRAEPEDIGGDEPPAFFTEEDEAFPIVEMPSDDEGDENSGHSGGNSRSGTIGKSVGKRASAKHRALDLVVLYEP